MNICDAPATRTDSVHMRFNAEIIVCMIVADDMEQTNQAQFFQRG
jgi:hypothetical protein